MPVSDNLGACMGEPGLLVRFHGAGQQSKQSTSSELLDGERV